MEYFRALRKKSAAARVANKKSSTISLVFCSILLISILAFILLNRNPEFHPQLISQSVAASVPPVAQNTMAVGSASSDSTLLPDTSSKMAIIIDDIGNHLQVEEEMIALDLDLTFSFLPQTPYAKVLSLKASSHGRDILLHLPMEPAKKKWLPVPGALMVSMPTSTIQEILEAATDQIPMAIGINNHMGSRFTENKTKMRTFLELIKPKNLFFIDSFTSSRSFGYSLAKEIGISTAKRDVFIDNVADEKKIFEQLKNLTTLSRKNKKAIGIGHPYPETLAALKRFKKELAPKANLVGVSQLVE